jgi:nucleotide-binding universal stress UspA family protein
VKRRLSPSAAESGAPTTKEIRRILLASDMTARDDRAFDRALMLARIHRATLCVAHVIDSSLLTDPLLNRELRDAQKRLEHKVEESSARTTCDVTTKALGGDRSEAIVSYASASAADLIVMGSGDYRNVGAAFRGTTVDQVIRTAACPVLAVKARPRQAYATIAVAVDQSEHSMRALEAALNLLSKAQITVIHVDEGTRSRSPVRKELEQAVALACARISPSSKTPSIIVKRGRAVDVLMREIDRIGPDLVALGTRGRTGVRKLFLGSVAELLLSTLHCDALIARV